MCKLGRSFTRARDYDAMGAEVNKPISMMGIVVITHVNALSSPFSLFFAKADEVFAPFLQV